MMEELTNDEIRLIKWFDGELSSDEVSDLLEKHPELYQQRMEIQDLGEAIRLHAQPGEAEPCEPPFPELFNRQVLRRISETPATKVSAWLDMARDWFVNSQWAVPSAAMVALTGILLSGTRIGLPTNHGSHSEVVHAFAPHPEHSATARFVPSAKATVIRLDGLEALAPTQTITGYIRKPLNGSDALASAIIYPHQGIPTARVENVSAAPGRLQLASHTPQ